MKCTALFVAVGELCVCRSSLYNASKHHVSEYSYRLVSCRFGQRKYLHGERGCLALVRDDTSALAL